MANDQDARNNNWGLCNAADIAAEIEDQADVPSLGSVTYQPVRLTSHLRRLVPDGHPSADGHP